MGLYKHLIVAVDLHPNCDQTLLEHAKQLATQHQAKITLVHAIEHMNAYGMMQAYPAVVELEDEMVKQAKQAMNDMGKKFNLSEADQIVSVGSPKLVVLDTAKHLQADLILVGSHGRHGLAVLLGSTANAILHNATCDVLVVRTEGHTE